MSSTAVSTYQRQASWPAYGLAALLLVLIAGAASAQNDLVMAFSVLSGAAFGIVLQRSRFCFFCVTRDFIDERDARGLLGIVVALAVGTLGYHVVFTAFLPMPSAPRLPPGAHIGPVSWVLGAGALTFGVGMAISGSCISAHLYRLGEGSVASIFALLGAIGGFALGFASWNYLYLATIQAAPVTWLPNHLGYGGSLLVQLAALAAVAAWLIRSHRGAWRSHHPDESVVAAVFTHRWPVWVGGILIAFIGVLAYFRSAPLGVTAELGSVARTLGAQQGWLPQRLEGLDSFAGCATVVKDTLLSRNGLFVLALVAGSWAAALAAGQFKPNIPTIRDILRNLAGGILMGWGAMVALGCTVGTLLSGVMAGAVSGWVFGVMCLIGVWLGWRARQWFGQKRV